MWLQWLHPTVVHFAIGLTFAAVLFDVLAIWRQSEKLLWAGYWNTVLGGAAAVIAVATGYLATTSLDVREGVGGALLPFHEIAAWVATLLAVALAAWRLAAGGRLRAKLRTLYLATAFLTAALIFVTGLVGGALVYAYGMGITPDAAQRVIDLQQVQAVPDTMP